MLTSRARHDLSCEVSVIYGNGHFQLRPKRDERTPAGLPCSHICSPARRSLASIQGLPASRTKKSNKVYWMENLKWSGKDRKWTFLTISFSLPSNFGLPRYLGAGCNKLSSRARISLSLLARPPLFQGSKSLERRNAKVRRRPSLPSSSSAAPLKNPSGRAHFYWRGHLFTAALPLHPPPLYV